MDRIISFFMRFYRTTKVRLFTEKWFWDSRKHNKIVLAGLLIDKEPFNICVWIYHANEWAKETVFVSILCAQKVYEPFESHAQAQAAILIHWESYVYAQR